MTVKPLEKKWLTVNGKKMAYSDIGTGDWIIFLHGKPMSSYVWRNIVPHVTGLGRTIVPDLVGMGDCEKLTNPGPDSYIATNGVQTP